MRISLLFVALFIFGTTARAKPLSLKPMLALQGSFGGAPVASVTDPDDTSVELNAGEGVALLVGLRTAPVLRSQGLSVEAAAQLGFKYWRISGESSGHLGLNRWPVELMISLAHSSLPLSLDLGINVNVFTTISAGFGQDISSFRASPTLGWPVHINYQINEWLTGGLRIEIANFKNSVDGITRDGSNYGLHLRFLL